MSYFPYGTLEQSYLASLGQALVPIGSLMGLDWRMVVALLAGFVAKENIIVALGILYGHSKDGLICTLTAQVAPASALAFLIVTMLFIPCLATVAVMRQETGSWRWTLTGVALLLVISLGTGILVYHGATLLGAVAG